MEYEVSHSIDFIWLTSGRQFDHTTLSEFRRKHGIRLKDIYRQMAQLERMEEQRSQDGIDAKKIPAQLPMSDPDSRILPNKEGGYAPNYTPMAVTETENDCYFCPAGKKLTRDGTEKS
jgi:hypothetical protein